MTAHARAYRHIGRGEIYHPVRYWSLLLTCSVFVHAAALAPLSGAVMYFLEGMPRPSPVEAPLLYVGLIITPPAPLAHAQAAPVKTVKAVRKPRAGKITPVVRRKIVAFNPPPIPPPPSGGGVKVMVDKTEAAMPPPAPEGAVEVIKGTERSNSRPPLSPEPPVPQATLLAANEASPAPFKPYTSVYNNPLPAPSPAPMADYSIQPVPMRDMTSIEPQTAQVTAASDPHIRITSPPGGDTDKGLIEVKGVVAGMGMREVKLTITQPGAERVMELLVKDDGGFETPVALSEGRNVLTASAIDPSGKSVEDKVVVNYRPPTAPSPKDILVTASYKGGGTRRIKAAWRPHPLAPPNAGGDASKRPAPVFDIKDGADGGQAAVSEAGPGIYTIGIEYDIPDGASSEVFFEATLFGSDLRRKKARSFGPVTLQGKGELPVVRALLPEGVFWEDDSYFSGVIESGRETTKFKEPEGIVWKEEE